MKLLFVGSRFLPYKHEGDKNFYLDLFHEIKDKVEEIHLISLLEHSNQDMAENLQIHELNPVSVGLFLGDKNSLDYLRLKPTETILAKTLSFMRILKTLRKIIDGHEVDLVHFMDVYGPLMCVQKIIDVPTTLFMPTYTKRFMLYDTALKLTFSGIDKVVVSSGAFTKKLIALGVRKNRIVNIPWGVKLPADNELSLRRKRGKILKLKLGFRADDNLLLWSGYLQQTNFGDFLTAYRLALKITRMQNDIKFVFALKVPHFTQRYLRYERNGIKIIPTTHETFLDLFAEAKFLISPINAINTISAPPLTWIESMAYGVPVITVPVPGADEIVIDGYNGIIGSSIEDMTSRLRLYLKEDESLQEELRRNARDYISRNYDITRIADEYLELWQNLLGAGAHE